MRAFRALTAFGVVLYATSAWAQYGLYGAPEPLRLPGGQTAPLQNDSSQSYPTTPAQAIVDAAPMYGAPVPAAPRPPAPPKASPPGPQLAPPAGGAPLEPIATFGVSSAEGNGYAGCEGGRFFDQPGSPCLQGACGESACAVGCCNPWYASVSALVLTRDQPNKVWTSYDAGDEPRQIGNTQNEFDWRWGGEVKIGRRFCCNQWAIEASYWGVNHFDSLTSIINTNPTNPAWPYVSTPLAVGEVRFNGMSGSDWFDNAEEHRIWRTDEVHNIELNLLRTRLLGEGCGPCNVDFLVGARYFRFREDLNFGSLARGGTWDDPAQTAFLNDEISNNLLGAQIGFNGEVALGRCLRFFATPKFGIYNNHIQNRFQATLGDGTVATQTAYPGETYPVDSSANRISFLAQLDLGVSWQVTQCLSAQIGYRVVSVSGIGLADNQIPHYIVDIPAIRDIDRNGNLLLHGAFVGATYNY